MPGKNLAKLVPITDTSPMVSYPLLFTGLPLCFESNSILSCRDSMLSALFLRRAVVGGVSVDADEFVIFQDVSS